jgi:hypothetical protein
MTSNAELPVPELTRSADIQVKRRILVLEVVALLSMTNAPTTAKICLASSGRANANWTACLPRFDDCCFGVTSFDYVVSVLSPSCWLGQLFVAAHTG